MVATLLMLALSAASAQAEAAQPAITSTYTTLDLDRCNRLDRDEEPEWARWRCNGFGGVPLFVQNGDDRYDVDAGREDDDQLWANTFDYPGKTVEWRIARGKPFAIIYRLSVANPDAPKGSRLIVETIGAAAPGCRIATIDGSTPRANEAARRAADAALDGAPPCLQPETAD